MLIVQWRGCSSCQMPCCNQTYVLYSVKQIMPRRTRNMMRRHVTPCLSSLLGQQLINDRGGVDQPATQPYISARFEALSMPPYFPLGNGQEYGAFYNRPLDTDDSYLVFLRAYSVDPVSEVMLEICCSLWFL